MKKLIPTLLFLITLAFVALPTITTSCTPAERQKIVNTAYELKADQIACILIATIAEEDAVMRICKLEEKLRPAVRELLAGKAAAQRASASRDAGACP